MTKVHYNEFIRKGKEFDISGNYHEAINCFKEAANSEHDDGQALWKWGNTLYHKAGIKQNQDKLDCFIETRKKYEEANRKKSADAYMLTDWAGAICHISNITADVKLFKDVFEKVEKATKMKPARAHAYAFIRWGTALYQLGNIKQKVELFEEAFKKFEIARGMEPNNGYCFFKWGIALLNLTRIKEDKKSLFKEAAECFKKSKMDILEILVYLDETDREYIINL